MSFNRSRLFGMTLTLFLGLVAAGCSNGSSNRGGSSAGVASSNTNNPPGTPGTPTTGGPSGTVGQLTGDPDNEVGSTLQQQVADAVARGDDDDPIDF